MTAKLVLAPNELTLAEETLVDCTIFLAGSIEMGVAELWQDKVFEFIENINTPLNFEIRNPRRDDWDASWKQDISVDYFKEQVEWELLGIEESNLVLFYFDPDTMSPITLMELGLCAGLYSSVIVCCPEGFWRKGNVQVICNKYDMTLVNTKEEFYNEIRKYINDEYVGPSE